MNFNDPQLVSRFGSWVKVQVKFYDYLFYTVTGLAPEQANEAMIELWKDGGHPYEACVAAIERTHTTPDDAWGAFVREENK